MKYKVVEKAEVSERLGTWQQIFNPIEYHQAVQIEAESLKEARAMARNIYYTLKISGVDYKTHYRIAPNGDSYFLYMWKGLKE
jgi:hypothetical protein